MHRIRNTKQNQKSSSLKLTALILIFTSFFFILSSFAGENGQSKPNETNGLNGKIPKLISKYNLTKTKIGIKVVSLTDNKVIYEKNPDTALMPASNMKLFTTGAALCILGTDFNYETTLYRFGSITDGVLKGNLIIKSNGNPNISGRFYEDNPTAVFEEWAQVLRRLGVKRIQGDIIIDDTAFDREYLAESWPSKQLTSWYCAPVSAVSFNDNCIDITVYADKDDNKVGYRLSPPTNYVTIINKCQLTTRKSSHAISFDRTPDTNTITIKGKFYTNAASYKESITINNPGLYFGTVLKETLISKKGIVVIGAVKLAEKTYQPKADGLVELASTKTDLLATLSVTNKNSQNFYAESILKTIGFHFRGRGTFKNGAEQIEKFLKDNKIITGEEDFTQVDGSGLSRENRVTADQIVKLLSYLARHKNGSEFRDTLPINGVDGSLKKRINGNGQSKRVWAKTGYIEGVSALSGYIKSNHTKDYAFSIIVNNGSDVTNARQFQDELVKLLID